MQTPRTPAVGSRALVRGALRLASAICCAALLFRPETTHAQDGTSPPRPVTFGLIGGFARAPQLDASSVEGAPQLGFNAALSAEARTPLRPLRLRADALYADWGTDRLGALTANVVLVAPVRWSAVPYLSGGGGGYRGREGRITAGYSAGVGLRLPASRRTVIVESRIHVFGDDRYRVLREQGTFHPGADRTRGVWLPINLGVQF